MPVYKVFTWNMQRAQSVSRQNSTIRERFRVLKALADWADFGFITEPGIDIRGGLTVNSRLPNLDGRYYVSGLDDNQNPAAACRPVVYSKHGFRDVPHPDEPYVRFLSGAESAHRYPALGIVRLGYNDGQGNKELVLVSFHATSGYNANENCQGYFDSFYQTEGFGSQARPIPLLWIVGGDFNHRGGPGIYMPSTSTHQSDHVLDGFFADQNGTNFEVTRTTGPQTYVVGNNPGEGQLITDTSVDPHGYVVNGRHLSDHCPVTAEFRIQRAMGLDTANILPPGSKRKRTQSTTGDTPPAKYPKT
jgi:hypothetical protein